MIKLLVATGERIHVFCGFKGQVLMLIRIAYRGAGESKVPSVLSGHKVYPGALIFTKKKKSNQLMNCVGH